MNLSLLFYLLGLPLLAYLSYLNKHVFIKKLLKVFIRLLDKSLNSTTTPKDLVSIVSYSYDKDYRCIRYQLENPSLLSNHDVLKPIYNCLMGEDSFKEFGFNKIIIITAFVDGQVFQFHHNVFITNLTTFEEYYESVKDIIIDHFTEGSTAGIESIPAFEVLVWNVDNLTNKHIKVTSDSRVYSEKATTNSGFPLIQKRGYHSISNLKKRDRVNPQNFATLDLETVELDGFQTPIAISLTSSLESRIFLINPDLFNKDPSKAVTRLWEDFFNYIETPDNTNYKTIFIHNLGDFDGIFLFKALSNHYSPDSLNTIIDPQNRFITITLKLQSTVLTFKDSLRVFPISLQELCKIFNVDGKTNKYKAVYNSLQMFKDVELLNEFTEYALQDSKALFDALINAQKEFIDKHHVDIVSIVSTSSLAFKIYRTNYLKTSIPILKHNEDKFIRNGYYGGATDYYKAYAKNLYYYDVNSLYPQAMLNSMPFKLIKKHFNMDGVELDNFFGFCLAEITCPDSIALPVLPVKLDGKTIYPKGQWTGTYFSEELKAVAKLGYGIKLLKGMEFSKEDLFTDYIKYFYNIKMNSSGSEKYISKLMLNCLYGIFGRRQEKLETKNVFNKDIVNYISSNIIKAIIPINDEISTLLMVKNVDLALIRKLNNISTIQLSGYQSVVKSNVAIAAAITAYARIHMIPFKLHDSIAYSDTDSIFTTEKLDDSLIGKEIGLMKDELNGLTIKEGYFLGIKQYGYWYLDHEGNRVEKSVFAGVNRDSLTFNEVKDLFNGGVITKYIPVRFFKSLRGLSIKIKPTKLTICKQSDKLLINNNYIPKTITNNNNLFSKLNIFKTYINRVLKSFKVGS